MRRPMKPAKIEVELVEAEVEKDRTVGYRKKVTLKLLYCFYDHNGERKWCQKVDVPLVFPQDEVPVYAVTSNRRVNIF
jgi:hypothetical protein